LDQPSSPQLFADTGLKASAQQRTGRGESSVLHSDRPPNDVLPMPSAWALAAQAVLDQTITESNEQPVARTSSFWSSVSVQSLAPPALQAASASRHEDAGLQPPKPSSLSPHTLLEPNWSALDQPSSPQLESDCSGKSSAQHRTLLVESSAPHRVAPPAELPGACVCPVAPQLVLDHTKAVSSEQPVPRASSFCNSSTLQSLAPRDEQKALALANVRRPLQPPRRLSLSPHTPGLPLSAAFVQRSLLQL
jgi:hypothetical protein